MTAAVRSIPGEPPSAANGDGPSTPSKNALVAMPQAGLWLGLIGLVVTLTVELGIFGQWVPASLDLGSFASWMALAAAMGFVLRFGRRKVFFGKALKLHQTFSFEALFQGAVLVHPQLPYPSVETEFIRRETGLSAERVTPWFGVRSTLAVAIPLALTGVTACLAERWVGGAVLGAGALGVVVWGAFRDTWRETGRGRFLAAAILGIGAALGEGLAFVAAALVVNPECAAWQCFLLYAATLTLFELTPVPVALGVVEVGYGALALVPGMALPGLIVPLAYRLCRGLPVVAMALFYLSRYKLSLLDLYDPFLPSVLSQSRRPPEGWPSEDLPDGPLLSVVIPAYNEVERLPRYLPEVVSFSAGLEGGVEVLVVDDGSTDGTADYVESVAADNPMVRLVRQDTNQGKGAAVRRGVMDSAGRYVLFADADGATPIAEVTKLLAVAQGGTEVVVASRKSRGGRVDRPLLRDLMGAAFYRLTNLLAVPGVSDTQCGFKLFRRVAAQRLFPLVTETGWAFDVEVLFLAQKIGMAIVEVPVAWTAIEGSKISPVADAIGMLRAVLRIRRRCAGLVTSARRGEIDR